MAKIIFITGGVSSGKSEFALKIASKSKRIHFVATALRSDKEMRDKIKRHIDSRPKAWHTIELNRERLETAISEIDNVDVVIIDCITLYVGRLAHVLGLSHSKIVDSVYSSVGVMKKNKTVGKFIVISNEVGMGIVPINKSARRFRETLGQVNKILAKKADTVYFMVSGISQKLNRSKRQ